MAVDEEIRLGIFESLITNGQGDSLYTVNSDWFEDAYRDCKAGYEF